MLITERSRQHFHFTPVSAPTIDHSFQSLLCSLYVPSHHIVVHCIVSRRFKAEQIGLICIKRALAESLSGKWAPGNPTKPDQATLGTRENLGNLLIKASRSGKPDQSTLGNGRKPLLETWPNHFGGPDQTTEGNLIKADQRDLLGFAVW